MADTLTLDPKLYLCSGAKREFMGCVVDSGCPHIGPNCGRSVATDGALTRKHPAKIQIHRPRTTFQAQANGGFEQTALQQ